ncbi:hypothetical protein DL764_001621 [Monosporascus ibericus]|uniref:Uncharacterized protein n=1 Tax=Monosporascus ibericus TaxID=155417 RepID=A0A4Q4TR31_9PEZI|nr:hypothetical protein DL764_001621 [Monosporascus ibericus]
MVSGSIVTAGDMNNVRDATFVTRTIPDISLNAGLVALCTVPHDRAGPDDLGWHISDFLAFKKLLSKHLHPKAQKWMAHCDIAQAVDADSLGYTHGKDRRILQNADLTGDIQVESSPNELANKFLAATRQKGGIVKKLGYDLVILVCGPTTLEQDVFFGSDDYKPRVRAYDIRSAMGLDDCQAKGMVSTPAMFSAGWQINPCFCSDSTVPTLAGFLTFLAKQFGAIFASHMLTKAVRFEDGTLKFSRRAEEDILSDKVHKALAARLMLGHSDHSFSFDAANDDWGKLIGPRRHKALDSYKQEWEKLAVADAATQFGPEPPLFGQDVYGKVQNPHQREAHYLATVFEMNSTDPRELDAAMDSIHALFTGIQFTQLKLLFEDPDLREKCKAWLNASGMPILEHPFGDDQEKPQEQYSAKKNIEADVPVMTVYMEDDASGKETTHSGNQPEHTIVISGGQEQKRSSPKQPALGLDKESDKKPSTAAQVPHAGGGILEASSEPDTVERLKTALKTANDRLSEDLSAEDFEIVMVNITNITKRLTTEKIKRDAAVKNKAMRHNNIGSTNTSNSDTVQQNTAKSQPAASQRGLVRPR